MTKQTTKRAKLTPTRITSFDCPPEKAQAFLWDADVPGLAVRATPPGKRTPHGTRAFIFQAYINGATPRLTIGDTKIWDIDAARIEARRLQTLIDQGIDPREQAREQAEAKAAAKAAQEAKQDAAKRDANHRQHHTLRAMLEGYCAHLEAIGRRSARQARSLFKCHVFEAYPDIAALPASEIDSDHLATVIRAVIEQGKERAAGALRSYLSAAFNAARKARYDAKLPASFIPFGVKENPAEIIPAIPINRGDRVLSSDELKTYLTATTSDGSLPALALKLALYAGGQRMAQLLRAKLNDYDPDTKTLRIWDGKGRRRTEREHLIPLAPQGAAIAEQLIRRAIAREQAAAKKEEREPNYSTLWLFSTNGRTQLAEDTPGKLLKIISEEMKGEPFDLRDIRRTVETVLAGKKISKELRGRLMSHGISGVQDAHYDKWEYIDEKRATLACLERHLKSVMTGKKSPKVVPLRGAA